MSDTPFDATTAEAMAAQLDAMQPKCHPPLAVYTHSAAQLRAAVAEVEEAYKRRNGAQLAWAVCNDERARLAAEVERLNGVIEAYQFNRQWEQEHLANALWAELTAYTAGQQALWEQHHNELRLARAVVEAAGDQNIYCDEPTLKAALLAYNANMKSGGIP